MSDGTEIVYAELDGRALRLDRYDPPPGSSLRTAVVMVHGGGWQAGDRSMMRQRAQTAASLGFTALAVEYRLLGEASWPAPLDDVTAAVHWACSHAAELDVDSDRLVLMGCSAGAHVALLTAAEPDNAVAAVVAFYPPAVLEGERAERLLGGHPTPAEARLISPLSQIGPGFPPTLLIHGASDAMVGPEASAALHERLLEVGSTSELHVFAEQIHEFDAGPTYCDLTQRLAAVFLRRTLIDPDAFAEEQRQHNPLLAHRPDG